MRTTDPANLAAINARTLSFADFLTFYVRDIEDDSIVMDCMWSGYITMEAEVIDPDTGSADLRTFVGAGDLVQISDIPMTSNLTVQRVEVVLSQVSERVNDLIRGYDVKQKRVEVHRGWFDPRTRRMVGPAEPMFVGFIDEVNIHTPAEGGDGGVVVTCVSHTQEITRYNPDTRSHESQIIRDPTDTFMVYAATEPERSHVWGQAVGGEPKKEGLFGWGNFLGFL